MDSTHLHLLLDRIREGQHHHEALLQDLAQGQTEALRLLRGISKLVRERPSSKPSKAPAVAPILTSGVLTQYMIAASVVIYVLRGGDILTAITAVAKAFGG